MARSEHRYLPVTEAALLHAGLAESLLTTLAYDETVLSSLNSLRKMSNRWQADYDAVRSVEPILEKARAEAGRPPVIMRPHICTTAHMAGIWASVALEDLVRAALRTHAAEKKDFERLTVLLNNTQPFDFFGFAADHASTIAAAAKGWELPEVRGLCAEIQLESHYLLQKETNGADGDPRCKHSLDFRSVVWYGTPYSFTATQAPAVEKLWQAWENGTPELSQVTILDEIGAESRRLSDLFAGHLAWKTMIVQGSSKGAFRLSEPPK